MSIGARRSASRRVAIGCLLVLGLAFGIVLLLLSSAGAAPRFAAAGPVHPLRTPQGNVHRGVREQLYSSNWSGYAVAHYNTGLTYTSASGTWTVPAVTSPPGFPAGYSASWVGIGGFCLSSTCNSVDNTLIQLGTEQDASSTGQTQYYAWYELLPKSPVEIPLTIRPGDKITASLVDGSGNGGTHQGGSPSGGGGFPAGQKPSGRGGGRPGGGGGHKAKGQTWTLEMVDHTTGGSWSTTLTYNSSLASAEWIEEAPYSGGTLPLANFGTATFDPGSADGASPGLTSGDAIVMLDSQSGGGETSNPSSPDSDLDGFNACWGNGTTLTSCSPPSS